MTTDLVGTIFAKQYKIIKLIGAGAFGKVYSAKSMNSPLKVAIKLV